MEQNKSKPCQQSHPLANRSNTTVGLLREMRNELECPICRELFREPKQLLCGHTFCQECLFKIASSSTSRVISFIYNSTDFHGGFDCPQCRCTHSGRVQDIVTNFVLKEMVEKLKEAQKGDGDNEEEAFLVCSSCAKLTLLSELFHCESCIPGCSSTKVGTPKEQKEQQEGTTQGLSLCSVCCIKSHNGHSLKPYKEIMERKGIDDILAKAKELTKGFEENKRGIKGAVEMTAAMLDKFKEELDALHLPVLTHSQPDIGEKSRLSKELGRQQKLTARLEKFHIELLSFLQHYLTLGDYYKDYLNLESANFENHQEEEMMFRQIRRIGRGIHNYHGYDNGSPPPPIRSIGGSQQLSRTVNNANEDTDRAVRRSFTERLRDLSFTESESDDSGLRANGPQRNGAAPPLDPSNQSAQQRHSPPNGNGDGENSNNPATNNDNPPPFGAYGGARSRSAFEEQIMRRGGIQFQSGRGGFFGGRGGGGRGGGAIVHSNNNSTENENASPGGIRFQGGRGGFFGGRGGSAIVFPSNNNSTGNDNASPVAAAREVQSIGRGGRISNTTPRISDALSFERHLIQSPELCEFELFRGRGRGERRNGNGSSRGGAIITGIGGSLGSVAMVSGRGGLNSICSHSRFDVGDVPTSSYQPVQHPLTYGDWSNKQKKRGGGRGGSTMGISFPAPQPPIRSRGGRGGGRIVWPAAENGDQSWLAGEQGGQL